MIQKYLDFEQPCDCGRTHRITTKHIWIGADLDDRYPELIRAALPAGRLFVVMDETTREVAGRRVADGLTAAGIPIDCELLPPGPEGYPVADSANVARVEQALDARHVGAVAVGSGTINDVTKLATSRKTLPYVCVATAPSMNGFTSAIAAVLDQGVKTTIPCHTPVAVIADSTTIAHSPSRMVASGLGDLLSKPVSNADWRLSGWLLSSWYCDFPYRMVEAGSELLAGVPERLTKKDPAAVARLMQALCLSGMAMAAAGSSSPASGGEHLISHYIDMTAIRDGLPHDFHGCQVGVGTLATASMYRFFTSRDPELIDVDAAVAAFPTWDAHADTLKEHFGTLAGSVVHHAEPLFPSHQMLKRRLESVKSGFDALRGHVSATLQPPETLEAQLIAAGGPVRFRDLGVDARRAEGAIRFARNIRTRYTILHLLSELGWLDEWIEESLAGFL